MERRGGALPPLRVGALAGAEMETRFLDPDDDIVFDLNLLRYYFANSPVSALNIILYLLYDHIMCCADNSIVV